MHPALSSADSRFTIKATCDGLLAKWENKLAANMNIGAPGG